MTPLEFTTTRLHVSPVRVTPNLLSDLANWLSPAVTQYLPPDLVVAGPVDAGAWLARLMRGGMVHMVHKDQKLIGFLTVHRQEAGHMMIGYLFAQSTWGQGLASELLRGLIDQLAQTKWSGEILGGVDPNNPASAAVLRKAGFTKTHSDRPGTDFYALRL